MIVYNTTYTVPNSEAQNFVIWLQEVFIPRTKEGTQLQKPRLLHILSHKDENTECFSLQFEVESTAMLHAWYAKNGQALITEMLNVFGDKVVGFSTIMEEIE